MEEASTEYLLGETLCRCLRALSCVFIRTSGGDGISCRGVGRSAGGLKTKSEDGRWFSLVLVWIGVELRVVSGSALKLFCGREAVMLHPGKVTYRQDKVRDT